MLVVLLLLPLSLAMDDSDFDHGGGGGGSPAAAAVAAQVAVDNDWRQKRAAKRTLLVAWQCAMTKADGRKQCNNEPMTGERKAGIGGGGNGNSNGSSGGSSLPGCR
jgi:hypothetical protein